MSIVFSAITPHPPILIPNIGKDNSKQLSLTIAAYEKLRNSLWSSGAETIIIISPHGKIQRDAFTMNLNPEYDCNFEEFGDFATRASWMGNIGLTHRLKEAVGNEFPLQLISEKELDHGSSVPLCVLTANKPKIKIIPLYYSGLGRETHFRFGQLMQKELIKQNESIAIIASGDLSHRVDKGAPGGFSPKGKKFDTRLSKYLLEKNTEGLLKMEDELVYEAGECGLKSILIMLGILDGMNYNPRQLSYEHPFGVGYLVMNMEL